MNIYEIHLPLTPSDFNLIGIGDKLLLSGEIFTARDQAHKRLCGLIDLGEELPIRLVETTLFYCGPSPIPEGKICGAIGPTTSTRMDIYTPLLLANGLKVMIGKGERSPVAKQAILDHKAVYLTALGGISALLSRTVQSFSCYMWEDLGPEAIYRLEVINFPVYVAIK